jgi:hypothetical protein
MIIVFDNKNAFDKNGFGAEVTDKFKVTTVLSFPKDTPQEFIDFIRDYAQNRAAILMSILLDSPSDVESVLKGWSKDDIKESIDVLAGNLKGHLPKEILDPDPKIMAELKKRYFGWGPKR